MTQTIVSLTSIPPRFKHLPAVIESLAAQSVKPDRIELYLPRAYRREEFNSAEMPALPSLSGACEIIRVDTDYGPATKILPSVSRHQGTQARLVYCDDDKIFHPLWLETLLNSAEDHPDCVIANSGQSSARFEAKCRWMRRGLVYRLLRLLSLGQWKPIRSRKHYKDDIAEGCNGVLIRPDFIDEAAFDIPDILWTVDDVWLSGIYQKNGRPLMLTGAQTKIISGEIFDDGEKVGRQHALFRMVYKGHNRISANAACIRYMRQKFGVFPKTST